ncbi:MAG: winged helix-turn-helix domain-containing protein, partial [Kangiellaceae bacterium]|nr:winged helix-turn-helix domain-containing protein [Kangiellaceae bacterium]
MGTIIPINKNRLQSTSTDTELMIYQFNDFQLDPSNFSLHKIGKFIAIEPQVFNLIIYLIENRMRLVTRDEIFENLWSDRDVLDATLSNHIKLARSILGDDGK